MKKFMSGVLAVSLLLTSGCLIIANCDGKKEPKLELPSGAQRVAGGYTIQYIYPEDGTAILVDETTGKIVFSVSKAAGERFEFSATNTQKKYFSEHGINLDKANFVLYFSPTNPEPEEAPEAAAGETAETVETAETAEAAEAAETPAP